MTRHHELAGQTVTLKAGVKDPVQGMVVSGAQFTVEDYWETLTGGSWMDANGNPAALHTQSAAPTTTSRLITRLSTERSVGLDIWCMFRRSNSDPS